jgi:thiol-disulfide isomerase/thioredoxin
MVAMRLGRQSLPWALGAGAVGLAVAFAVWLAWPKRPTAPPAAAVATTPRLKGEMGDFSYFASPKPVPPISFQDAGGRTLTLADFKGRVLLVNFWATWCQPCVREMPSLDRLQARLGGPDFTVLDLSLDRTGKAAVAPYFAENKLSHLGIYLDPEGRAFHAWQGRGVPTSFLIGRDGRAHGVLVGPAEWDSAAAIRVIEQLMGQGKGGLGKLKETLWAPPASEDAG